MTGSCSEGLGGSRAVACFLLGFWLVTSLGASSIAALDGPEAQLLERVNRVRREHHLKELTGSPELAHVSLAHARDMASAGYLSHINTAGQNPLDRAQAAGVNGFRLLAENIAQSTAEGDRIEAVVREWLRSPDHRENLLNPAFNTTGIAVVPTATGAHIYVQLYATF